MTATEDLLAQRREGLGGTDSGPVLGIREYAFDKTGFTVWQDKLGLSLPKKETFDMRLGTAMEPVVAEFYAEATKRTVRSPMGTRALKLRDHPWIIAHPDRYADDGGVELKTAGKDTDAWGPSGSMRVPEAYRVQVEHYMLVTGRPWWDLCVLFKTGYGIPDEERLRVYHFEPNKELRKLLVASCDKFWKDYVETRTPPPIVEGEEPALFREARECALIAEPRDIQVFDALAQVQKAIKVYEDKKKKLAAWLQRRMETHDQLVHPDTHDVLVRWNNSKGRRSCDFDKLAAEFPEAFAACVSEGEPGRTFKPNYPKD